MYPFDPPLLNHSYVSLVEPIIFAGNEAGVSY
jgi:hypothetical protein